MTTHNKNYMHRYNLLKKQYRQIGKINTMSRETFSNKKIIKLIAYVKDKKL